MTPSEELLTLIERFVSGEDRSLAVSGEIEGLVLEFFPDAPWFDEVSAALAQYSPVGGRNYYTGDEVAAELTAAARTISGPPPAE